jgi:hypothetical protein
MAAIDAKPENDLALEATTGERVRGHLEDGNRIYMRYDGHGCRIQFTPLRRPQSGPHTAATVRH